MVSAAISLSDALDEIARVHAGSGGDPVRFNLAGSNVLARQIVNGAPADLFISADSVQMDYAQRAGAVDARSRIDLLSNRLAVVVPRGRAGAIADIAALLRPAVRRIAVGDPAAVPAGVYARQYLERVGVWQALQPKLLPLANVRAALAAAENGGADAAIVYASDAAASKHAELSFVIEGPDAPRIVYPAAIVTRSPRKAAATRFLEFLRGPVATRVFKRYGFSPSAAG